MKKTRQLRLLSSMIFVLFIAIIISWTRYSSQKPAYRDLNKNGKIDVYEDKTKPIEKRVVDILQQMTIEEKAGMMFINGAKVNEDGSIEDKPAKGMFAFAPNHLSGNIFAMAATDFSQWCEPLGFAASGDEKLMWQCADRVRQEYVAAG